jgi:carboxyl-terminal processing protease
LRTAQAEAAESKAFVDSFELIWATLRDRYWDPSMAGLNWQAIHQRYLRKIQAAKDENEARELMAEMIERLPSSHLAVIPGRLYAASPKQGNDDEGEGSTGMTVVVIDRLVAVESVEPGSAAMEAGVHPGWAIESVAGVPVKELFTAVKLAQPEAKASLIAEIVQSRLKGPVASTIQVSFTETSTTRRTLGIVRRLPPGTLVQFGNLPPEHVLVEHRKLESGVGYIRLNLFLDPVTVMPEFENAIHEFKDAPGIVLDLRNNPGGLGMMAMGLAGWFVSQEGLRLGTMTGRDLDMNFDINPRLEPYTGRMAILVNAGSASTTEILAQGLQDLKRARIFGTRTAGAALPSEIIELPDGDRFQYPAANYVSVKGRILEGNGVQPDVVVKPTIDALLANRDLPLEAASTWSKDK